MIWTFFTVKKLGKITSERFFWDDPDSLIRGFSDTVLIINTGFFFSQEVAG